MFEHIERLVGQYGREFQHQGRECSVAPQRFEFRQVLHRSLAALASEFKPIVLVNPRGALGLDAERANQDQSFDQLWKIARRSCISGLP